METNCNSMSVGYSFKFFFRPFLVKLVKSETESKSILGIKLFGSPLRNQTLDTQPTTTKTFIPSQCGKDFIENFQNGLSSSHLIWKFTQTIRAQLRMCR